jgi:type I restriction enzyme S subunit
MSVWKEFKLGEVAEVKYGKAHQSLADGNIPAYGSGGLMRYVEKPLYDDESILIPRKGTLNNIIYKNEPFWTVDTMFYTKLDKKKVFPKFLFYQLSVVDFTNMNVGSAVPSMTVQVLDDLDIILPPLPEQTAIAEVLSSLDDKIDLLHRQNKALEQLAETLFRQWFVEEAEESWEREPLGKHVTIKRGGSPRPIHDYISETGLNWLKISDVTSVDSPFIFEIKEKIKEEGLSKTTLLKKGSLVLSNSATPGIPKILDVDSCIHDGWLHFPQSKFSTEFLYLLFKHIRPELIQMGNGSIFTNLKTDILKEYVIAIPDNNALNDFDEQVKTIFEKLYSNTIQIRTLTQLRDTLLPKLMSGEVSLSNFGEVRRNIKLF